MSSDALTGIFKSIQFYYHIKEEGKERKDLEYRFQSRDYSGDIKRQTQGIVWLLQTLDGFTGKRTEYHTNSSHQSTINVTLSTA